MKNYLNPEIISLILRITVYFYLKMSLINFEDLKCDSMPENEWDLEIANIGHDHHVRHFKHDIIFDIHIPSNKSII